MKKIDISEWTVVKIRDVYTCTPEEETEAEAVAACDLLMIKKQGRSVYTVGGERLIADAEHIVFLPVGTAYELYAEEEGACTVIELELATEQEAWITPEAFFTGNEAEIGNAVKNILHYWSLKGPAYHSKCLSELYSLLTEIAGIQAYAYSLAGKYGMIHRSVKYIEANYKKPDLYTPMLADLSNMGETYYRNIFQSVFGVPPTRYIQQYRVEKAKECLLNSSASVEEIAVAVGFANSSYFCKVFKSLTGLTPSEFAEKGRRVG
ncbi:MAG: helix-turn-helix transcriptional regulator [Ruminococcaceae bacterium]|nr:helix-turn-helix transcriptional regulator [Oscillospiraceae bacterium]